MSGVDGLAACCAAHSPLRICLGTLLCSLCSRATLRVEQAAGLQVAQGTVDRVLQVGRKGCGGGGGAGRCMQRGSLCSSYSAAARHRWLEQGALASSSAQYFLTAN